MTFEAVHSWSHSCQVETTQATFLEHLDGEGRERGGKGRLSAICDSGQELLLSMLAGELQQIGLKMRHRWGPPGVVGLVRMLTEELHENHDINHFCVAEIIAG